MTLVKTDHISSSPQQAAERAVSKSKADGLVVIVDECSSANLRWAGNSLISNGFDQSRRITVIAVLDGAQGTAAGLVAGDGIDSQAVDRLASAAEQAARANPPARDAQPLLEPSEEASRPWQDPPRETSIEVFSDFAPALAKAFSRARAEGRRLYGYAEHSMRSTFLASSEGLRLRHDQPSGYWHLTAKPADSDASVWAGEPAPDFSAIEMDALDEQLAQRARWSQRSVRLPAGRYETLLPPSAVADLMLFMYGSAGALDAHEGGTAFSKAGGGTRVGEPVASLPLTLRSDPHASGLQCRPFLAVDELGQPSSVFDNGLPLQPTDWISQGDLAALVQSRHSSQLTELALTPFIDNLILEEPSGTGGLDEMIESTSRGLLLTCLWYLRMVDPGTLLLTGLTRDGVFLIEGGEVVGAVNNFRFNESPLLLLQRIQEIGATQPALARELGAYCPRTAMPALRIGDFNMTAVSQAL